MIDLDHLALNVRSYERSKLFYQAALKPLGLTLIIESASGAGFGRSFPHFWVREGAGAFQQKAQLETITPVHVAFRARSRAEVDAFFEAALSAGARDFGRPSLRPQYHPGYYGAFVIDPDGHNIEAVTHGP